MLALFPYKTDAPRERFPGANWAIMAATFFIHVGIYAGSASLPRDFILGMGGIEGYFGYMFLHGGWLHLIGNLLFLWVFGNAVCSRVGNLAYPLIYVALGFLAGVIHMIFDGQPAVGASGAINGVLGIYLCFFPRARISMFWLLLYRWGVFAIQGFWIIGLWLILDLLGALLGGGGVAYYSHLGGMAFGFLVGVFLVYTRMVKFDPYERPLFKKGKNKKDESRTRDRAPGSLVPGQEPAGEKSVSPAPPAQEKKPQPAPEPAVAKPARRPGPPPIPVAPGGESAKVQVKSDAEGNIVLVCPCGNEIRKDAKWQRTKTICPRCFKTLDPDGE